MVSQTLEYRADFGDLLSIIVLDRIFVVGSVFSGPMALAIDLDPIAWAAPSILASAAKLLSHPTPQSASRRSGYYLIAPVTAEPGCEAVSTCLLCGRPRDTLF
jgi:hypothetical protein